MKKRIAMTALSLLMSYTAFAGEEADHVFITPEDIVWVDAPASLPAGAKAAMLFGDLTAAAPFSFRIKFPANYQIPEHFHPADENVTVISGTIILSADHSGQPMSVRLPVGSFARMKANMRHSLRTEGEAIVQVNGVGPWGITYVNPEDDPR